MIAFFIGTMVVGFFGETMMCLLQINRLHKKDDAFEKGYVKGYSTNWQIAGRELMTPDEVRMLDNRYALLFIRGERPIQDFKYDILKHPNVTLTTDGKAAPYQHGLDTLSIASIVFDEARQEQTGQEPEVDEDRYELISDEEIEEFLKQQEENEHEEKQKA